MDWVKFLASAVVGLVSCLMCYVNFEVFIVLVI